MDNEKENNTEVKNDVIDEDNGVYFSSVLKITDPESGEVILHMRCDE